MINIRKDLIEKELAKDKLKYQNFTPTSDIIDKLYSRCNCIEHTTHFYDEETDDEEKRLATETWIDVLGIEENKETKTIMKNCMNDDISSDNRWYGAQNKKYVLIYFYGRDYMEADMWWVMLKKGQRK